MNDYFIMIIMQPRKENVVIVVAVLCGVPSVCHDGLLADRTNITQKPG